VNVVLGVDGGNTKTELVAASLDGEPLAYVRGGGSNSHGPGGAEGCVSVIAGLVERSRVDLPVAHAAFFLCGADIPSDIAALEDAVAARRWTARATIDNDTFALLRAGTDAADAIAVICGAGINCVGRNARGEIARYPALGWETGDWGGGEAVGREALFLAARAEDGRGEATELVDVVRSHFGLRSVAAVGEEVHYRRIREVRLGELAPAVVAAAELGDAIASGLVERLAGEVALLAWRALRDLELLDARAEVVLGGGMLRPGKGALHDAVLSRVRELLPRAIPVVAVDPPVLGATLAALDDAGAPPASGRRLREAFRAGLVLEEVGER
jgi:N-acetylglucosamine kinase-like BadF-type ATPase